MATIAHHIRHTAPGRYPVRWLLPTAEGVDEIAGEIFLDADRAPSGELRGSAVLEWTIDQLGGQIRPKYVPAISAVMGDNTWITLVGAQIIAFGDRITLTAEAALAGSRQLDTTSLAVGAIVVHTPSIVYMFDWSSGTNTVKRDGVKLAAICEQHGDASARYSGWIQLDFNQPLELRDAIHDWVEPLRRVLSINSGAKEELGSVSVGLLPEGVGSPIFFDLYGTAIFQRVDTAIDGVAPSRRPAHAFDSEEPELLQWLGRWKELDTMDHPLVALFGSSLYYADRPRTRFLEATQSLEAAWYFDRSLQVADQDRDYTDQRDAARGWLAAQSSVHANFSRDNLPSRPSRKLSVILQDYLAAHIDQIRYLIAKSSAVEALLHSGDAVDPFDAVRVIRNRLSHGEIVASRGLPELALALELAVKTKILERLGVSHSELRDLFPTA